MLLGKGGRWATAGEFTANPPQNPEDLTPPAPPGHGACERPGPGSTLRVHQRPTVCVHSARPAPEC